MTMVPAPAMRGGMGSPPQTAPQPQDDITRLWWGYLMQLRMTNPQRYHVIAKQYGLPPYDRHGTHPEAMAEFVQPHSGQPGTGEVAGYGNRF